MAEGPFGPFAGGGDAFSMLDELIAEVRAGNSANVAAAVARTGGTQPRIGAAANREVEDVDMAEAVMELQVQEVAYSATLQALARALPSSLVSFLR